MPKFIDLVGRRIGQLTFLERLPEKRRNAIQWRCVCDCGSEWVGPAQPVKSGIVVSCGCVGEARRLAGAIKSNTRHGKHGTTEYRIYRMMLARCLNENHPPYRYYGGRGIKVCDRWLGKDGFANFYSDMGPRPSLELSLDRIDNDGPYDPANCRWATRVQQQRNKRSSVVVEFGGMKMTLAEWASRLGVTYTVLMHRRQRNWPVERMLQQPARGWPVSDH